MMAAPKKISPSIEKIPEELLIKIISSLDIKEAIRTSVISRRWRHLWKYTPNIVIDDRVVQKPNGAFTKITDDFFDDAKLILHRHREPLESLIIRFYFKRIYERHVDDWILYAIASKAKKLVVNLQSPISRARYNFPCHLFPIKGCSIEFLELKRCSLDLPIQNFDGFKNLVTIRLELVPISREVIRNLFPICVALKDLSFISCYILGVLEIPISLSKLEALYISGCDIIRGVECYAPNLSMFTYCGGETSYEVSIKIKALEKACISSDSSSYVIDHLPQAIASVKTLVVEWKSKVPNIPQFQDRFVNLKHLDLLYCYTIDIYTTSMFIDASPSLETLVVRIWGAILESGNIKDRTMPKCPHNHLKSVTMAGFTGDTSQFELVRMLLLNATQLEIMTIETSTRYSNSGSKLKVSPLKVELERKIFYKFFRRQVPQHVKLLVL